MDRETQYNGFLEEGQLEEEEQEQEPEEEEQLEEEEEQLEEEEQEEEEQEPGLLPRPMVFQEFAPKGGVTAWNVRYPQEYVEHGTMIFRPIQYPSEEEWRYASQVLESQILFTTSDAGPQPPQVYTTYLVGRVYYSSPTSITTDYMMSYERNPRNSSEFIWVKYMATYYNKSPMPHEKNVFYPYPLPLRFYKP
jgi:hypothetical protein